MTRLAISQKREPDRHVSAVDDDAVPLTASEVVDALLAACGDRDRIVIGDVVDQLGAAGFPMLVLVLVLPALLPIPGPYGMVFGTAVAILAIQMIIGRRKPWLPAVLTRRSVSTGVLTNAGKRARGWLITIETLHAPGRFEWLARQKTARVAGLVILPLSIMIGLPIPFGNVPPVAAIAMIAFALILRDGLALILAFLAAILAAAWVAFVFWFGGELLIRIWPLSG
ncbi:MAG: exopolysaccharide biosynthesis protein [Rhizobiaceae bacterium]|nr:exopolysaccharide biosynthesis protein [Rhizobiaceae bacterium]